MSVLDVPPYRLSRFTGHPDSLRTMIEQAQGLRGEKSLAVRRVAEDIVREIWPKDYLGELLAVRAWVAEKCPFLNDPLHVELIRDPEAIVDEVARHGKCKCDCDEIAEMIATLCLCLGRVCQYVVVGFGEPGKFSHVFARAFEPKAHRWVILDPVAGTQERRMAGRVTTSQIWTLDELPDKARVA